MTLQDISLQNYALRSYGYASQSLTAGVRELSSGVRVGGAGSQSVANGISLRLGQRETRMNAVRRSLDNAISFFQVRDGYFESAQRINSRMQALAVRAIDANRSALDRQNLDAEFQDMKAQLDGFAQASFNGNFLFFPVNPNATSGQTSTTIDISKLNAGQLKYYQKYGTLPPGYSTKVTSNVVYTSTSFTVPINEDLSMMSPKSFDLTAAVAGTGVALTTQQSAYAALAYATDVGEMLASGRAAGGADLQRLLAASDQLQSAALSNQAANSRIRDTDFVVSATRAARAQAQLSSSMWAIAQSGVIPERALDLLSSGRAFAGTTGLGMPSASVTTRTVFPATGNGAE